MATEIKSHKELYDLFVAAIQEVAPDLTDTREGSSIDALAGVMATAATELNRLILDKFNKTYFDTAHGPEVTGDADDLETLAVDHFGSTFARPEASKAGGTVTFSRASTAAGNVLIPKGTVVKTAPNSNGVAQRFETTAPVTLTTLSINASVVALVAGPAGNVLAGTVNELESALTDSSVVVTNAAVMSGGAAQQDDAAYRETIRNKIEALRGASLAAIQAKALTVLGVETATAIEQEIPVVEYDLATLGAKAGAAYFRIPYPVLYIADVNGTASTALVGAVVQAIEEVRAAGVHIAVKAAVALSFDWTAVITLNPAGPNYAEYSSDASAITAAMRRYINELPIGQDFDKAAADAAMLAIFGPSGSNDLVVFSTLVPSGNVVVDADKKLIAGVVRIA